MLSDQSDSRIQWYQIFYNVLSAPNIEPGRKEDRCSIDGFGQSMSTYYLHYIHKD